MRTVSIGSCFNCKRDTNYYDMIMGRVCPTCAVSNAEAIIPSPPGMAQSKSSTKRASEPAVKTFPEGTEISFGVYVEPDED